jgi:cobalt-zinc-cadmium efflux system membrane fusion protein
VWLTADQAKQAKIEVNTVEVRSLSSRLITGGKIAFDDLLVSHVYSPVTGRVTKIDADLGQQLNKGDALALIDSPDLGQAYSDMLKANADLVAAQHDIKRQKELLDAEAVAPALYEQSEDNYRRAQAEMERAELKVKLLRASKADFVTQQYTLRAPIAGEVVGRQINPGTEVQGMLSGANIANELFTVGSLSRVWMLGDVYEADLSKVKAGISVDITTIAYPTEVFKGTVDYVGATLDPNTRVAHMRCTIDNPDKKLRPEMYVTATLGLGTRPTVAIPRSAVLTQMGNQRTVFVQLPSTEVGSQRYAVRPVTLGDSDGDWVEILHGLLPGDVVVTDGALLLSAQI